MATGQFLNVISLIELNTKKTALITERNSGGLEVPFSFVLKQETSLKRRNHYAEVTYLLTSRSAMKRRKPRKPLAEYRPDLALQWHPTRNGQLTPMDVGTGTKRKVWWKCPEGDDHEWEALISSRASGRGCPFCAGYGVSYTNSLAETYPRGCCRMAFPQRMAHLLHGILFTGRTKEYSGNVPKGEDHEWEAVIVSRTRLGSGLSHSVEAWLLQRITTLQMHIQN